MMERQAIISTLLLASYFTSAESLSEEFGAMLSSSQWASALDPAANWALDQYFQHRVAGLDVEAITGEFWIDEVEPRARRLFAESGVGAVEAFYVVALISILDVYWVLAPQFVATEHAPALAQLRYLARRAMTDPAVLSSTVRDAAGELARAWQMAVERLL